MRAEVSNRHSSAQGNFFEESVMYGVGLEKDSQGLVVREVPEPFIEADNQVLVKVLYAGTCGTDRNMINYDEKDFPPGEDFLILVHETVGRVEAVGPGVKTVVICPHKGCQSLS